MPLKPLSTFFAGFFLKILIVIITLSTAHAQHIITVSAGGFDRSDSIVEFAFPEAVEAGIYIMHNQDGEGVPVQVDEQNRGWFVLKNLPAGESRTYKLSTDTTSKVDQRGIHYTFNSNTVTFSKQHHPVLSYYHNENNPPVELDSRYKRAGYIHPLFSPEGVPLTNHLDTTAHPHQSGVFTAWTKTEFQGRAPDFWNPHNNSGRVDHIDSLDVVWDGPVFGGLIARNNYIDISASAPVTAINEEWQLRIFNNSMESGYFIVDLIITHTANSGQPLTLPEYHYGGTAFRGHQDWNDPENVTFLTSEGYDRNNSEGTRARWTLAEGKVGNDYAGMAMLGHPDNFRSPQPIHIHNSTPYFVYVPMRLGKFSIDPGSPYEMRYRLITYDGEADTELIESLWNDYAYPPGVTVTRE